MSTNAFRKNVISYINNGIIFQKDKCLSILGLNYHSIKNANYLLSTYDDFYRNIATNNSNFKEIELEYYKGSNPFVLTMSSYLEKYLKHDLLFACVHGSLGTYEEISYSDFDAIIILKKEVFQSATRFVKVSEKLFNAKQIMFQFDPLQHHGWFILTEADFKCYPEEYFPSILFRYAKSILLGGETQMNLNIPKTEGNIEPFTRLATGIITRLNNKIYPKNIFDLKRLLSQFMMLPSLYIQAHDNKYVFKKNSFELARKYFDYSLWSVMDEVSSIRQKWRYNISSFQKYFLTRPEIWSRKIGRFFIPKIDQSLKIRFDEDIFSRMANLTEKMLYQLREK